MRANGVDERFCTGDAPDRDKFEKFAETMPYLLRNPIYIWCHLELCRYFDIDDLLLSPKTSEEIWERSCAKLSQDLTAREMMKISNVKLVCTSDDPIDSLEHHLDSKNDPDFDIHLLPTWRSDRALAIEDSQEFNTYVEMLEEAADMEISSYESYICALRKRHDFFHDMGCRLSDHGIDTGFSIEYTGSDLEGVFTKTRSGRPLEPADIIKFRSAMLVEFNSMDSEKGWTKQLHIGALRDNNSEMRKRLGRNTGFDAMGDAPYAKELSCYLDRLNSHSILPKTILYNCNPCDYEMLVAMIGAFQDGSIPGKLQLGGSWWFMDQSDGIGRQIEALSQIGLLSRFVGMVTDSRSFVSFARHEYFRRILCDIIGGDMAIGRLPRDFEMVGGMVRDISYANAVRYLGLPGLI